MSVTHTHIATHKHNTYACIHTGTYIDLYLGFPIQQWVPLNVGASMYMAP